MGGRAKKTLYEAIATAGSAGVHAEYARRAVRKIIGDNNIPAWNDHPYRTKRDVLDVLSRAVAELGGSPLRRGGWHVGGAR